MRKPQRDRRLVVLTVGVGLPTLLLGLGWFIASLRAQDDAAKDARAELARVAKTVRATVDESLEELRQREDERPFYLYNHYYSPPDVLAVSDPVAVSPLASAPPDARVLGYFQLERSGRIRTPYAVTGAATDATAEERDQALREWLESSRLGQQLGHVDGSADAEGVLEEPVVEYRAPAEQPSDRGVQRTSAQSTSSQRPGVRTPRARARPQANNTGAFRAPEREEAGLEGGAEQANVVPPRNTATPEGPLTTNLEEWNNFVAEDIQLAQQGSFEAQVRVQQRGRAAPLMNRRNVQPTAADVPQQAAPGNAVPSQDDPPQDDPSQNDPPQNDPSQNDPPQDDPSQNDPTQNERPAVEEPSRQQRPRPRRVRVGPPTERPPTEPPVTPPAPSLMPMQQRTADIDYTPMRWWSGDGQVVLHREVSHQGVSVLQGVVLQNAEAQAWIGQLVDRHTPPQNRPTVVSTGDDSNCAVRHALSDVLPLELCFATAVDARLDSSFYLQLGMLAGLLLLFFLALWAIVRATERANRLAQQQSEFVAAVSHELRTPLTAIRMHAEMLQEGIVSEKRAPRVHDELVGESARLARLVENVLEASRLGADQRKLLREEACVATHVARIGESQRAMVEQKGPRLEVVVPKEPLVISFDAQALEQIVINLLDNATKYASASESIELRVTQRLGGARIVVADRGPGIPQGQEQSVFERFFRVDRESEAHAPGTGIGLSLVRELTELHGGSAFVRAREGGGLEVIVELPG